MTEPYIPNIIFYHFPCSDGLCAAAIARTYYGDEPVDYQRFNYGDKKPIEDYIDMCRDKKVLMLDCSFRKEDALKIQQSADSLIIVDHHITALKELEDFQVEGLDSETVSARWEDQKIQLVYDVDHSGASLTWMFFHPTDAKMNNALPLFIQYIEDIDLGKVSLPNAAQFRSWSRSIPFNIKVMQTTMQQYKTKEDIERACEGGIAIDNYVNTRITVLLEDKQYLQIENLEIPYVITDYAFASDCANALLKDAPNGMSIAFYFTTGKGFGASIRSIPSVDCSEFARKFGGGGHKNAAGFNIPCAENELTYFLEAMADLGNDILGIY
jgi:oligoribonuclease NrnB/cAMP/cGMP phosphodiesterase (DHH superfamily)